MAENNKNVCEVCGSGYGRCGNCGHACGFGGYHLLRWVLGIIIISWIFCLGMWFGQMSSSFSGGYGYRNHMYYKIMPMMQGTYPAGGSWTEGDSVIFSSSPVSPMMGTGAVKVIKTN